MLPWALLLLCAPISGILGWLRLGTAPQEVAERCGPLRVPFEVMAWIPLSCIHPSKEELAGILSSCQARMEGPQSYLCTLDMEEQVASLEQPEELWGSSREWMELEEAPVAHWQHQVARLLEDIAEKMETLLAAQQNHTVRYYEEVMEKLWRMNRSLGWVLSPTDNAWNHPRRVGTAGLDASTTWVPTGACLLLLALLMVPAVLLLLALLGLVPTGPWLLAACGAQGVPAPPSPGKPCCHLTSTPKRRCKMQLLWDERDGLELSYLQDPSCLEQSPTVAGDPTSSGAVSPVSGSQRTKPSSAALLRRPVTRRNLRGMTLETGLGTGHLWEAKPYSPSQCPASNTSSLSPRLPCQGVTRAGQRCRKRAVPGQVFCWFHGCRQRLSP